MSMIPAKASSAFFAAEIRSATRRQCRQRPLVRSLLGKEHADAVVFRVAENEGTVGTDTNSVRLPEGRLQCGHAVASVGVQFGPRAGDGSDRSVRGVKRADDIILTLH